ncbi:MAG: hypothetical protein RIS75_279 [Actinomycetota bacterium]
MNVNLILVALAVVTTAFFIAIETAISKLSVARIEELQRDESDRYATLAKVVLNKPNHVNALQVLQAAGWAASTVLTYRIISDFFVEQNANRWSGLTVVAMTLIGFIVFGVGARTLGKQQAEVLARTTAPVVRIIATLLAPFVRLLILIGNAITPGKGYQDGPFASAAELREMVDLVGNAVIEEDERRMLHSVFELGDTVAREVMVPRTEMVWIESTKTLRQAMSLSLRSGYSRIPVVGEDIDDVIGVIYIKDIARRAFEHHEAEQSERVESLMRPAFFAPDSRRADELLRDMQQNRTHLCVLIDEYGGTAGLVTVEDIVEEIVGEISDEHDTAEAQVIEIDSNTYRVSTRLHIEDLAELIDVSLNADDEGIDTVGGLLAARLGRVAIPGSVLQIDAWTLTAESTAGRRNKVGSVLVTRDIVEEEVDG